MDSRQAKVVASAIRNGQTDFVPKADPVAYKEAVALLMAICRAAFGIVVSNA